MDAPVLVITARETLRIMPRHFPCFMKRRFEIRRGREAGVSAANDSQAAV